MRISRFHVPAELTADTSLILPEQTAHYIRTVLRMKEGTGIVVFNGDGSEFAAMLEAISKREVRIALGEQSWPQTESPLRTHLGLGLTRGERMDFAIQKCTELGATSITPLFTERAEVRLNAERSNKRQQHWQQIAISACEQSGRVIPPTIAAPVSLSDWLASCSSPWKFIFDHRQDEALPLSEPLQELSLLTGPEGGFTDEELAQARAHGFRAIALGPRVFRAETAPLTALSVLQWHWGDIGRPC